MTGLSKQDRPCYSFSPLTIENRGIDFKQFKCTLLLTFKDVMIQM